MWCLESSITISNYFDFDLATILRTTASVVGSDEQKVLISCHLAILLRRELTISWKHLSKTNLFGNKYRWFTVPHFNIWFIIEGGMVAQWLRSASQQEGPRFDLGPSPFCQMGLRAWVVEDGWMNDFSLLKPTKYRPTTFLRSFKVLLLTFKASDSLLI